MEDERSVSRAECINSRNEVIRRITDIHDEVQRQGTALYGTDYRGGIQNDMTLTKEIVGRIEKSINGNKELVVRNEEISVKRLMLYITVVCTIVTAVVGPVVVTFMQHLFSNSN